jgi:inhibitor of cysteine peptidase
VAEWTLTEAQNGRHLEVRVGDTIVISLPESGGGYQWSPASLDEAYLAVERQHYETSHGGVGSAGSEVWRLLARRAGHTRVELKKSRSWESDAIAQFGVELKIADR